MNNSTRKKPRSWGNEDFHADRGAFMRYLDKTAGLREITHAALENRLEFAAGDVDADVGAGALGVAHLAEHPPSALEMPSTAIAEPLGLWRMSMVGVPSGATYWKAIWPGPPGF